MPAKISLVGQTFGRLKVISEAGYLGKRRASLCICECGTEKVVANEDLRSGHAKSCGCYKLDIHRKRLTTHGKSKSVEFIKWAEMIQRCTNPNHRHTDDYGGRGIKVCERWKSFALFFEDMGECPKGLTLERIDPNGNYEPGNCIWDTWKNQNRNKRNSRRVTFRGEEKCLGEWCEILGLNYQTVISRLQRGWTPERAFLEPPATTH